MKSLPANLVFHTGAILFPILSSPILHLVNGMEKQWRWPYALALAIYLGDKDMQMKFLALYFCQFQTTEKKKVAIVVLEVDQQIEDVYLFLSPCNSLK